MFNLTGTLVFETAEKATSTRSVDITVRDYFNLAHQIREIASDMETRLAQTERLFSTFREIGISDPSVDQLNALSKRMGFTENENVKMSEEALAQQAFSDLEKLVNKR